MKLKRNFPIRERNVDYKTQLYLKLKFSNLICVTFLRNMVNWRFSWFFPHQTCIFHLYISDLSKIWVTLILLLLISSTFFSLLDLFLLCISVTLFPKVDFSVSVTNSVGREISLLFCIRPFPCHLHTIFFHSVNHFHHCFCITDLLHQISLLHVRKKDQPTTAKKKRWIPLFKYILCPIDSHVCLCQIFKFCWYAFYFRWPLRSWFLLLLLLLLFTCTL